MALVGDVIISGRELMTDLPATLTAFPVTQPAATATTGGTLGASSYFVQVTVWNQWGESAPSTEIGPIVLSGANTAIQVTANLPVGATKVRVYFGNSGSGSESFFQDFLNPSSPFTGLVTNFANSQPPPARSSAYLPDSDGAAVSASAIYRWLNQALAWAAAKNRGGLPDFGAVGTINEQGNYVMPGYWKKIDSAWFDGYPLGLLYKNNVFRRNPVPGFSGMLIVFQATDRLMIEAWPQPNRTSNQTTLSSSMTATDTVANLTSVAGQVLGFGMYQIDSEIVNYSDVDNNQLQGLIRGMCGTVPAAHSNGAPAIELNLMIAGYRVPSTYTVGQATSTLYLPPGWDEALASYLLYRFRKAEQDEQGAAAAYKEATEKIGAQGANRIIAGPRQISPYSAIGPEVGQGLGTAFGGVVIP